MPPYSPHRDKLIAYMRQRTDSNNPIDRFVVAKELSINPQTVYDQLCKYEGRFFARLTPKGEAHLWYYIYSQEGERIASSFEGGFSEDSSSTNNPVARWRYITQDYIEAARRNGGFDAHAKHVGIPATAENSTEGLLNLCKLLEYLIYEAELIIKARIGTGETK